MFGRLYRELAMFEFLNDWRAWSGAEQAAVAAFALCLATAVVALVGV
jgi:uncharacterized membrane protein